MRVVITYGGTGGDNISDGTYDVSLYAIIWSGVILDAHLRIVTMMDILRYNLVRPHRIFQRVSYQSHVARCNLFSKNNKVRLRDQCNFKS